MTDARSGGVVARAAAALVLRVRTAPLPSLHTKTQGHGTRSRRPRVAAIGVAAVVVVIGACKAFLPRGLPNAIILLGAEVGGLNAMSALGIVLVYRANRVLNFAQGELGAVAASLAFMLMLTLHWSWFAAVPLALAAATVVGALVDFGIVRRFFTSPRLIPTVATIGIAQILVAFRLGLPGLFPRLPPNAGSFPSPFGRAAFRLDISVYSYNDVVILVVVPVVTAFLALLLTRTWAGLGTRAASENVDRSRLLGIRVRRLSTLIWAIAGLLSGLAAVLAAPVNGFSLSTVSGSALLVRALAPAAVGGFENLPLTFVAAVVFGVVEQAFFWNYSRGGPLVTLLLIVLVVALLVRGRSRSRLAAPEASSWTAVRDVRRVPRAVRELAAYRATVWGSTVAALAILAALPLMLTPGRLELVGLVGITVIAGLSLLVLTGWIGQVSLGQWAIVGVGAFVAGNLAVRFNLDFFVTLVIGSLAGGIVSVLLGLPAQRLPGMLFGVTTLAFAVAAENWLFVLDPVTRGASPSRPVLFGHVDTASPTAYYYVMVGGTIAALWIASNIKRYRLADVFVAARDNPRAAEAYSMSVAHARRLAFGISGCLAGYAGVLYAFHQGAVDANRFPADASLALLSVVVIGGLGAVSGVVAGAVLVRVAQYMLPAWIAFFTTGIGLLVVLLVFPGGIGEVLFRVRYRVASWFGRRRGVIVPPAVVEHPHAGEPILDESVAVP